MIICVCVYLQYMYKFIHWYYLNSLIFSDVILNNTDMVYGMLTVNYIIITSSHVGWVANV